MRAGGAAFLERRRRPIARRAGAIIVSIDSAVEAAAGLIGRADAGDDDRCALELMRRRGRFSDGGVRHGGSEIFAHGWTVWIWRACGRGMTSGVLARVLRWLLFTLR